jgi:hypothetical protein
MGNARIWIFRLLLLAGVGLLLFSWFQPWWSATIETIGENAAVIRPWTLELNMPEEVLAFVKNADMPAFFAPLMWTYLILAVAALVISLFLKNKEIKLWKIKTTLPSFLITFVGFSYLVVAALAVIVAAIRTGDFYYMKLLGTTLIDLGGEMVANAYGYLLIGYWLAVASGAIVFLLGIFRNRIIGKN